MQLIVPARTDTQTHIHAQYQPNTMPGRDNSVYLAKLAEQAQQRSNFGDGSGDGDGMNVGGSSAASAESEARYRQQIQDMENAMKVRLSRDRYLTYSVYYSTSSIMPA